MPSNKRLTVAALIVSLTLLAAALASFYVQHRWQSESWSSYAAVALIGLCFVLASVLRHLRSKVTGAALSVASPNWRKIQIGAALLIAAFLWSFVVGIAIRYGTLPDTTGTGVLLIVPDAILLIAGAFFFVRGVFAR